jgi:hypothetical protein
MTTTVELTLSPEERRALQTRAEAAHAILKSQTTTVEDRLALLGAVVWPTDEKLIDPSR